MEMLKSRSIRIIILASFLLAPNFACAFQIPVIAQANIAPASSMSKQPMPAAIAPQAPAGKLAPKLGSSAPAPAAPIQEAPLPKYLEGVVTVEEFKKYVEYQTYLRNQPEIKILNDKIMVHVKEMQVLQAELEVLRKKALESDLGAKEVGDKIQKALEKVGPSKTAAPMATKP
jgi:hypothetical protein